jgi:cell division transport system permease protein
MKAWINQHRRAIGVTAAQAWRSPFSHLFQVLVIGVAILLPLLLHLAVQNLQRLGGNLPADARIALYLAADATGKDADQIAARLKAHPAVAGHRFVSREEAIKDLRRIHDIADLVDALPKNPLPDAFIVRARSSAPDDLEALRREAAKWPKVALAQLDAAWAARLDAGLDLARALAAGLAALLAGALLAIAFNTIGLQVVNRREEIEVCRLIGATHGFIRRPFLYAGLLQGAVGGAIACGLAALCIEWVNRQLPGLAALYETNIVLLPLAWQDVATVTGFAGLLGWLGAWLAVSRHLWRGGPA